MFISLLSGAAENRICGEVHRSERQTGAFHTGEDLLNAKTGYGMRNGICTVTSVRHDRDDLLEIMTEVV